MYFPYVRGRQYELLALRELVDRDILSDKVIPVVEPVKLSATLIKTIREFIKNNKKVAIICNPKVGNFSDDMRDKSDSTKHSDKETFINLLDNPNIMCAHIMKENSFEQLRRWEGIRNKKLSDWIIINNDREYLSEYNKIFSDKLPKLVFIPDESAFRRSVRRNRILFADRFNKCERNSDYAKKEDEFFSEDHIYYEEDGFKGFSDYSIIGEDYFETGFAPYAVAIHIVYFQNNVLRIHHFVSDTNDDIQNPAGKFYEAVCKLAKWQNENKIETTLGLNYFLEHYEAQTYPGLGSIKKFSLMHHLELIGKYLNGVK